jgi:hypothetical protein
MHDEDVRDEDVHNEDLQKNRELRECERKWNSGAFMSRILAIQILYLAAFAAAHSFMASRPFKGLMWRILGPRTDRLYMKFFSIFAAITFAPLILMILIFPGKEALFGAIALALANGGRTAAGGHWHLAGLHKRSS